MAKIVMQPAHRKEPVTLSRANPRLLAMREQVRQTFMCPTCQADIGFYCRNPNGSARHQNHEARVQLWRDWK